MKGFEERKCYTQISLVHNSDGYYWNMANSKSVHNYVNLFREERGAHVILFEQSKKRKQSKNKTLSCIPEINSSFRTWGTNDRLPTIFSVCEGFKMCLLVNWF